MDLIFSTDSARNTTLSLPSGQPLYDISTPSQAFHTDQTTISKIQSGRKQIAIGRVEMHSLHTDVCQVSGRDMLPKKDGIFRSGLSFTSSNGQKYTWKRKSGTALLSDKSKNIASYERSHSGFLGRGRRPAKLSVAPEGVGILDEIVVTYMYIEQRPRSGDGDGGDGGDGGGSGDGGGGGGGDGGGGGGC
ncbi:hypothetical protein V5O48_010941 [Marasmius crinis-equi]|uniref:DUF6593 domain-containing protein n=1 Tax=Marasmius crinis-equi TaxID=585013 RepID=A0ABR3F7E9_9AGAR